MSLNEILAGIFKEILDYEGKLTDDLNPSSVSGWDSVAHISLTEALESAFDIRISTDDMVEMTDVRKIKDMLKKHHVGR